jgi:adenine-specific DNA-methyltransferase
LKLFNILDEELRKNNNFVSDNGDVKKWVVIGKAQDNDTELIQLLLNNKMLKGEFFNNYDNDVLIFNKHHFIHYLEQKSFLDDSYTIFKNKIGLTINNKYLKQVNDVALVWPYKDCILEGGQSWEEEKRQEIFFNETISQDEITQLFEPKLISNLKLFSKDGEHDFLDFSRDEGLNNNRKLLKNTINNNLVIKGNNLLALHTIKKEFMGKIKLIYIDPPYNTGGAANTFQYNNTFNHSTWLTFMKNRLEISYDLLADDGVICVAIDDEEYAHLKLLCDEIFKRDNYIGTIVIQSNPRGRTTNAFFATCHDYALFYAKNPEKVKINFQDLTEEQKAQFNLNDEIGDYRNLPFRRSGGTSTPSERPRSEFSIYYSKTEENIVAVGGGRLDDDIEKPYKAKEILTLGKQLNSVKHEKLELFVSDPLDFLKQNSDDIVEILPIDTSGKRRVWRWADRKKILQAANNGDFNIVQKGERYTVQLKDRSKGGRKPKTIWSDSRYDASSSGTMLLKKMFDGEKPFSYPKSIHTVKDTIQMLTDTEAGDIILDFFGGSGTTAHAVLELNHEDEGNRQFIIIEQMDYIEDITVQRIIKAMATFDKASFTYFELKKYNQIFVEQINCAENANQLLSIWEEMKTRSFLNYNLSIEKQEQHVEDFMALSLNEQKIHLCEILDKNQLYVNLSSLHDGDHQCSEEEIRINTDFYQIGD